jgi:hypothetical protein
MGHGGQDVLHGDAGLEGECVLVRVGVLVAVDERSGEWRGERCGERSGGREGREKEAIGDGRGLGIGDGRGLEVVTGR